VLLVVSMLPLATMFNQDGEQPWHLAVPALAQITLMGRVLRGEAVGPLDHLLPLAVCVALVVVALAYVARQLRTAAVR
jgi:sodium transport system permease protein